MLIILGVYWYNFQLFKASYEKQPRRLPRLPQWTLRYFSCQVLTRLLTTFTKM